MTAITSAAVALAVVAAMTATPATAGTAVYGYGANRNAAMREADTMARAASLRRFGRRTCYARAEAARCRRDLSEWVCIAVLANHQGSCR